MINWRGKVKRGTVCTYELNGVIAIIILDKRSIPDDLWLLSGGGLGDVVGAGLVVPGADEAIKTLPCECTCIIILPR